MKETLLLYHVEQSILEKIQKIANQLHIQIQIIDDEDVCQTMGYILNLDGFLKNPNHEVKEDMSQEFIYFAGMSDNQLDILLQLFKMEGIPSIPYKAMLTKHNLHYTFEELYSNVKDEYFQMLQMNQ